MKKLLSFIAIMAICGYSFSQVKVLSIPIIANHAFIYVYNLQGIELKSFPVTQGFNTITIHGSELPAGMYLYALVVDNEIIDTKRMILTK